MMNNIKTKLQKIELIKSHSEIYGWDWFCPDIVEEICKRYKESWDNPRNEDVWSDEFVEELYDFCLFETPVIS